MQNLWTANPTLESAARWQGLSRLANQSSLNARELAILITLGIVAAAATSIGNLGIPLPGHAILRGTLPLVLGISLVPRRGSGTVMSMTAVVAMAFIHFAGARHLNPAAATGLVCLGPALDLAFANARAGWRIYVLAALAGAAANLIAFSVRFGTAAWLNEAGKGFRSFWPVALASFVVFGALAGTLSALIWFKSNPEPQVES